MNIPGITAAQLAKVRELLPLNCVIKLFGSRVAGNYREFSDLDLCIISDISRADTAYLNEKFEESDLPFTVDVVLYKDCSDEFKKIIDSTGIQL